MDSTRSSGRPIATALIVVAALIAAVSPGAAAAMIWDRTAILHGGLWRLWTGHAVHLGAAHLFWNLAVVVPAGVWLERAAPWRARWFLGLAPAAVSAGLLVFEPGLGRYAGLSALATGLVVLLALDRLEAGGREPRWIWLAALGLVAAKLILEWLAGSALFAPLGHGAQVVPAAHLLGCAAALALFPAARPHRSRRNGL